MLALGEDELREAIKTIGLYRTKARNVIALSKALIEQHGGEVPKEREQLEALPGVGRKTANVVLNVAFSKPTIAVDTHIFRVANRTKIAPGRNPREVEDGLEKIVPKQYKLHAHHWLILHGRYICVARKPRCPDCPIADFLPLQGQNQAARQNARSRKDNSAQSAQDIRLALSPCMHCGSAATFLPRGVVSV